MKTRIKVEVIPDYMPLIEWLRDIGAQFNKLASELESSSKAGAIGSLPEVKTPARTSVDWTPEEMRKRLFKPEDSSDG